MNPTFRRPDLLGDLVEMTRQTMIREGLTLTAATDKTIRYCGLSPFSTLHSTIANQITANQRNR